MRALLAPLIAVAVAVGCGSRPVTPGGGQSLPPTQAPSSTPSTKPSVAPSAKPPAATAYAQIASFVHAAKNMDVELRLAATAINTSGPPWQTVSTPIATAVRRADPARVASTLKAGMPHRLLTQAMLVYSDLVSRRMAMRWFDTAGPLQAEALDDETQTHATLRALANGHPAALRFDSDVGGLIALAKTTPRFDIATPSTRTAAELMLLVQNVNTANGGCLNTGGQLMTALPRVAWNRASTGGRLVYADGGYIGFEAHLHGGHWQTNILAC